MEQKINFSSLIFSLSALLFLTAWGLGVYPVYAKPPPWAPAHGYRAKHQYQYYPKEQVYYSPEQKRYFWLEGGSWKFGIKLPDRIVIGQDRVTVDLNSTQPYSEHATVVKQHPRH